MNGNEPRAALLDELRLELSRITADGTFLPTHVGVIARLRDRYNHSISFVEDGGVGPHGYNCFMYALGVRELPPTLVKAAKRFKEAFPGSAFVLELLTSYLQKIDEAEAHDGSLAIYFEGDLPTHAGVLAQDGFVVSKWGKGHLWRHRPLEVPSIYGGEVRFFHPPIPDEVLRRFIDYVERVTRPTTI